MRVTAIALLLLDFCAALWLPKRVAFISTGQSCTLEYAYPFTLQLIDGLREQLTANEVKLFLVFHEQNSSKVWNIARRMRPTAALFYTTYDAIVDPSFAYAGCKDKLHFVEQFGGVKLGFNLMLQYEARTQQKFGYVVRHRHDTVCTGADRLPQLPRHSEFFVGNFRNGPNAWQDYFCASGRGLVPLLVSLARFDTSPSPLALQGSHLEVPLMRRTAPSTTIVARRGHPAVFDAATSAGLSA